MRTFNFRMLLVLSLGHLVTDIYQSALPAILPFLKEKLVLSYTRAGVILMAASFTSSLIQPLFGFFSDLQNKPLLLPLGCLCAGVSFSLISLPSNYALLLVLVIFSGLGIASYHPQGFKTAYYFTGEKRVTGMAVFSVGGNFGFALGPVLALYIIKNFGFTSLPFIVIPSLIFTVVILYHWSDIVTDRAEQKTAAGIAPENLRANYISMILLVAVVMMRSWIHMGLMSYIPFYYINYLKGDPMYAGKLVSAFLLGGVAGTIGGSPLADRWGHKRYVVLSMALTGLVLPLIFVVKGVTLFVVLAVLGMITISSSTVTIVMAQHLLPHRLGIASGLMVGFAIGAGGICVTLLGVLADRFGVPFALRSIALLPWIGLFFSLILRYSEQQREGR